MSDYPKNLDSLLTLTDRPVVSIDQQGLITFINKEFTRVFGWTQEDLVGNSVTMIMPEHFRDAHQVGFSRFLTTEVSTLAGKPLALAVLYKDGTVADAEHYILAEKRNDRWYLAATICPTPSSKK